MQTLKEQQNFTLQLWYNIRILVQLEARNKYEIKRKFKNKALKIKNNSCKKLKF